MCGFFLFNRINKISQRNWCIQYITHRRLWIIKAPTPTHNRAPTPARPTQVNVPNPAIILEVHEVVQDCVLIYLTSYVYFIRLGLFVMFRVKGFGIRRYVFLKENKLPSFLGVVWRIPELIIFKEGRGGCINYMINSIKWSSKDAFKFILRLILILKKGKGRDDFNYMKVKVSIIHTCCGRT